MFSKKVELPTLAELNASFWPTLRLIALGLGILSLGVHELNQIQNNLTPTETLGIETSARVLGVGAMIFLLSSFAPNLVEKIKNPPTMTTLSSTTKAIGDPPEGFKGNFYSD